MKCAKTHVTIKRYVLDELKIQKVHLRTKKLDLSGLRCKGTFRAKGLDLHELRYKGTFKFKRD